MLILENNEGAALLAEIFAASDRAAAIIGASIVEAELSRMLQRFLRDDDAEFKTMTGGHGCLHNFAAKISIGYMAHVYGKGIFDDLSYIRKIRNGFAHDLKKGDFSEQGTAAMCSNLIAPDKMTFEQGSEPPDETGTYVAVRNLAAMKSTPRGRFMVSCEVYGAVFRFYKSAPGMQKKLGLVSTPQG